MSQIDGTGNKWEEKEIIIKEKNIVMWVSKSLVRRRIFPSSRNQSNQYCVMHRHFFLEAVPQPCTQSYNYLDLKNYMAFSYPDTYNGVETAWLILSW